MKKILLLSCIAEILLGCRRVGSDTKIATDTIKKADTIFVHQVVIDTVYHLLSHKTIKNSEVIGYPNNVFLKSDHISADQAVYLQTLFMFKKTNPTANEFIKWQERHPFPNEKPKQDSLIN